MEEKRRDENRTEWKVLEGNGRDENRTEWKVLED